jgi:hypothetical protein
MGEVTSLGASQFIVNDANEIVSEVGASILTGALITTGGGFSSFQEQVVHCIFGYLPVNSQIINRRQCSLI